MERDLTGGVLLGTATGLGVIAGLIIGAFLPKAPPARAYSVPDLNQDGIADFIVENNVGHNYPLFGIQEGDKLIYVPASEIEQRQEDAVIKVDYGRIEDLLNKQ